MVSVGTFLRVSHVDPTHGKMFPLSLVVSLFRLVMTPSSLSGVMSVFSLPVGGVLHLEGSLPPPHPPLLASLSLRPSSGARIQR